eukprot:550555-Pelagomonas_calceolata.AAC.5
MPLSSPLTFVTADAVRTACPCACTFGTAMAGHKGGPQGALPPQGGPPGTVGNKGHCRLKLCTAMGHGQSLVCTLTQKIEASPSICAVATGH